MPAAAAAAQTCYRSAVHKVVHEGTHLLLLLAWDRQSTVHTAAANIPFDFAPAAFMWQSCRADIRTATTWKHEHACCHKCGVLVQSMSAPEAAAKNLWLAKLHSRQKTGGLACPGSQQCMPNLPIPTRSLPHVVSPQAWLDRTIHNSTQR